ncbi:MAG: cobyric acid synthase CobQ, partial [Firmicutes bacterium]|nr:cobyric acid synthase CobQ [Bacillota bacterium]
IHGIFDAEGITDEIIRTLCEKKGADYSEIKSFNLKDNKEKQYDLLAETLRRSIDMKLIYEVMR